MAYATYEEVIVRYPVLENRYKEDWQVNSDLIYYAEMELNSKLGSHFSVPFSGNHPTIKDLTIDLAYYRALLRQDPDKADKIHGAINGRIDRIKEGRELVFTGSNTVIWPSDGGVEIWSTTKDYYPTHSMLGAEHGDTRISSEYLDALEDTRD